MKHNISGIDKAELLVALYDNAKNSAWTKATLDNMPFLRGTPGPGLNEARSLLSSSSKVDYIGPVLIKIDFRDEIDTSSYDKDHAGSGGAETAMVIIAKFKPKAVPVPAELTCERVLPEFCASGAGASYSGSSSSSFSSHDSAKSTKAIIEAQLSRLLHVECSLFKFYEDDYDVDFTSKPTDSELKMFAETLVDAGLKATFIPKTPVCPGFDIAAKIKLKNSLTAIATLFDALKSSATAKEPSTSERMNKIELKFSNCKGDESLILFKAYAPNGTTDDVQNINKRIASLPGFRKGPIGDSDDPDMHAVSAICAIAFFCALQDLTTHFPKLLYVSKHDLTTLLNDLVRNKPLVLAPEMVAHFNSVIPVRSPVAAPVGFFNKSTEERVSIDSVAPKAGFGGSSS